MSRTVIPRVSCLSPLAKCRFATAAATTTPSASTASALATTATTATRKPRAEGTIASVFASLSGEKAQELPDRFRLLKQEILDSHEKQQRVKESWDELVDALQRKNAEITALGSEIIPEVDYTELAAGLSKEKADEIKATGVAIVRGVVDEGQARSWLESIKEYIALNPSVKGFPENDKAVYEVYWSKAQIEARSHPNAITAQRRLLSLFDSTGSTEASTDHLLTYCDRLRIRRPGDAAFALGPHCDGGSVERWEDESYRESYRAILDGRWKEHDAWDIGTRPNANMNKYDGPGSCGVFRALQGWTSLSKTGPGEGTLMVYPDIRLSSAYMLLRPFFSPSTAPSSRSYLSSFTLSLSSPSFPGSPLGRGQEFSPDTHPHLDLGRTMTPLKPVRPGDQAWWHCDTIHAVESSHRGKEASAVMYIPTVPLTRANARYVADQRETFESGRPPCDFPGGVGEMEFIGRGGVEGVLTDEGRRGMGVMPFDLEGKGEGEGVNGLLRDVNRILRF